MTDLETRALVIDLKNRVTELEKELKELKIEMSRRTDPRLFGNWDGGGR